MEEEKQFEVRDMRRKEKFFVDDLYLNGYAKKCGIYATGVYLSLCRHANKEQLCYPSLKKIAEELKVSIKQIGRAIKILEKENIIKKIRIGKKCNNRYLLLDKSEWTDSPFTMDYQSNHIGTDSPFHSKDTHSKDTKERDFSFKRKLKPYYEGFEMRRSGGKWYVLRDGDWLDYADTEDKIKWN
jgi:hypothetical protein